MKHIANVLAPGPRIPSHEAGYVDPEPEIVPVVRFPTAESWKAFIEKNPGATWVRYCRYGCGGAGMFRHPRITGKYTRCPCMDERREAQVIEQARATLSPIEQNFTLANWIGQDTKALDAAKRAAAQGWGMFVFYGDYGRAKTGLLAGIVNDCIDRKIRAAYKQAPRLLQELRGTYDSGTFDAAFNEICEYPVLAIDEMWRYKQTEWAAEQMFNILEERYRFADRRLTVLATNQVPDPEQDAIWSRMTDRARCEIHRVGGVDVRPIA